MKRFFQNLVNAKKRREQSSLSQIQCNSIRVQADNRERAMKFTQITDRFEKKLERSAQNSFRENLENTRLLSRVMWTANSRISRRVIQKTYDALVFNNRMVSNAKKVAIITNLTRKTTNKYKSLMQQAFTSLAGDKVKSNCQRLASVIEKLILLREHHAYDSVLYYAEYKKKDKLRDGIVHLIRSMDKFREKRINAAFESMKIDNPWFKRVVSIMTLKTHADTQISFWRLKY